MNPSSTSLFAPSELALLRAEDFVKPGGMLDNTRTLNGAADVSTRGLARVLLVVAILAGEQAGGLRLAVRQKRALFGLSRSSALFADPTGSPVQWPAHSLEESISALAERLRAEKGQNDVCKIVYTLVQRDAANPWAKLIEMVTSGLTQRGLLQMREKKQMVVFRVAQVELPQSTADLAGSQPVAPIQQWLRESESQRPELHSLLMDQIERGLKQRVEQTSLDTDS